MMSGFSKLRDHGHQMSELKFLLNRKMEASKNFVHFHLSVTSELEFRHQTGARSLKEWTENVTHKK